MRVVVDTNILVSAVLNRQNKIGEMLILGRTQFVFFAPNLVKIEFKNHQTRLVDSSKLSLEDFEKVRDEIFECINFLSEEIIEYEYWHKSIPVVRNVDIDDIAFVALAEFIDAKLWTGDKKLLQALKNSGNDRGVSTDQIYEIWLSIR